MVVKVFNEFAELIGFLIDLVPLIDVDFFIDVEDVDIIFFKDAHARRYVGAW